MAIEDFNTYTIAGAEASKVQVQDAGATLYMNSVESLDDIVVYKDAGPGVFTNAMDFSVYFEQEYVTVANSITYGPGCADENGNFINPVASNKILTGGYSTVTRIFSSASGVGATRTETSSLPANQNMYCWLRWTQSSRQNVLCGFYPTAQDRIDGTNAIIATPYATYASDPTFQDMRYIIAMQTRNGLDDASMSYYIRNLEFISPTLTPPEPSVKANALFFGQDF